MSTEQVFVGTYEPSLDSQRRLAVPRAWRSNGDVGLLVLPGRDKSLQVMPQDKGMAKLAKLRQKSMADRKAQMALRALGALAQPCTCDKQGRIVLTPQLMQYAQISSDIVAIGCFDSFEIWSKETYESQALDVDAALDALEEIDGQVDDLSNAFGNLLDNRN